MTQPGSVEPASPGWWPRTERVGTTDTEFAWETSVTGVQSPIDYRGPLRIANPAVGPMAMRKQFRRKPQAQARRVPVTFDAVGATSAGLNTAGSETHVLGSTAKALIAFLQFEVNSTPRPTITVTAGGVSMTELASVGTYYTIAGPYNHWIVAFGLLNPPTGSQSIAWTSSVSAYTTLNSLSYNNVYGFGTPVTGSSGVNGTATLTIPSDNAEMVVAGFASYGTTTWSAFNKTQRYNVSYAAGSNMATVAGDTNGGGPQTISATGTTSWGGIGIPLLP